MKIKKWMWAVIAFMAFGVNSTQKLMGSPSKSRSTDASQAAIATIQSAVGHLAALVNNVAAKDAPKSGNAGLAKGAAANRGKLEVANPIVGHADATNASSGATATYRLEITEGKSLFSVRVYEKEGEKIIRGSGGSFIRKDNKLTMNKALDPWVNMTINEEGIVLVFGEFYLTLRHREDRHGVSLSGVARDKFEIKCDHIVTAVDGSVQFNEDVLLEGNEFIN